MNPDDYKNYPNPAEALTGFRISQIAAEGNPVDNKNYRCNPSILVEVKDDTKVTNVLIDCGKTFRESIIRWFPKYRISKIDAIVLTHGHADAIFGLDDVRMCQPRIQTIPTPVFLTEECRIVVKNVFGYLFPTENKNDIIRHVSNIECHVVKYFETFSAAGFNITTLPVMHGEDMTSAAFLFGRNERVCYISDISRMLPESLSIIMEQKIDLLVVDALCLTFRHPTHYSMEQAIELCRQIKPKRALLIGMTSQFDHDVVNADLKKLLITEGLDIQLAYDGLCVEIDI